MKIQKWLFFTCSTLILLMSMPVQNFIFTKYSRNYSSYFRDTGKKYPQINFNFPDLIRTCITRGQATNSTKNFISNISWIPLFHEINPVLMNSDRKFLTISLLFLLMSGLLIFNSKFVRALLRLKRGRKKKENPLNYHLLESLQLGIAIMDVEKNLKSINPILKQQFHKNFNDYSGKKCYQYLHPELNKDCLNCPVTFTLQDKKMHESFTSYEFNGDLVYHRIQSYPVFTGEEITEIIEIIQDVTKRINEEDKLYRYRIIQNILSKCTHALLHSETENILFNKICQAITDNNHYLYAWIGFSNPVEKTIKPVAESGYEDDFLVNIKILYDENQITNCPAALATIQNQPRIVRDIKKEFKSGLWFELARKKRFNSMACLPIHENKVPIGILCVCAENDKIFNDDEIGFLNNLCDELSYGIQVFRRKASSEKLVRQNESLKKDRDAAEFANRKKNDFLASITHEIRTPLTGILGMTDILLSTELNEDERLKYLHIIKSTANHQLQIINDTLDLTRIESGKLQLDKSEFNLIDVINEVLDVLDWQFKKKNLKRTFLCVEAIPEKLIGDPLRIKQIFYNLIGNSIKFTHSGEISISIEIEYRDNSSCKLKFIISDTGIGIPHDKQHAIFESYVQADISILKKYGGTGLGTAITKKLVEIMGGSIGFHSPSLCLAGLNTQLYPGTDFWFTLNFKIANSPVSSEDTKVFHRVDSLKNTQRAKILVAEDNEVNQILIKIMLEKLNHDVDIAINGFHAVEMAEKNKYDIIFMDMEMPELNGIEATRIIKDEMKINVPIIALTAMAFSNKFENFPRFGMDDYVLKPYKIEDLHDKIIKWGTAGL